MSAMLMDAVREPAAVGAKVTLIAQVALAATVAFVQVSVFEKSLAFVPPILTVVMARLALPLLVSVTLCAVLVVPTLSEVNVRLVGARPTAGAVVVPPPPPPPPLPPHAAHTPTRSKVDANRKAAGRRRIAGELRSPAKINIPANTPSNPTGKRRLGGILRSRAGGALEEPVVVMLSTSVTAVVPVTLTEGEAKVQVAPAGHPLTTDRLTVPVNPFCGLTLIVEVPGCPGAEIVTGEGFAETPKSVTAREVAADVEVE